MFLVSGFYFEVSGSWFVECRILAHGSHQSGQAWFLVLTSEVPPASRSEFGTGSKGEIKDLVFTASLFSVHCSQFPELSTRV